MNSSTQHFILQTFIIIFLIIIVMSVIYSQYRHEKTVLRIMEICEDMEKETDLAIKQELGKELRQLRESI